MHAPKLSIALIRWTAIPLFLLSLVLPAVEGQRYSGPWSEPGILLLLAGWIGAWDKQSIFAGAFAWYGNPLFILSLALLKRSPTFAAILACFAFLLGCTALGLRTLPSDSGPPHAASLGWGGYVWLLSLLVAATGALTRGLTLRPKPWPTANNWQYRVGIACASLGVLLAVVISVRGIVTLPPRLSELRVIDATVLADPEVVRSLASPWFIKMRTDWGEMKIANACFLWSCSCDCPAIEGFSVRKGDRIRMGLREGLRDEQIWELIHPQGSTVVVLSHNSATAAHGADERRAFALAAGMLLAGALMALWAIRRERSSS